MPTTPDALVMHVPDAVWAASPLVLPPAPVAPRLWVYCGGGAAMGARNLTLDALGAALPTVGAPNFAGAYMSVTGPGGLQTTLAPTAEETLIWAGYFSGVTQVVGNAVSGAGASIYMGSNAGGPLVNGQVYTTSGGVATSRAPRFNIVDPAKPRLLISRRKADLIQIDDLTDGLHAEQALADPPVFGTAFHRLGGGHVAGFSGTTHTAMGAVLPGYLTDAEMGVLGAFIRAALAAEPVPVIV